LSSELASEVLVPVKVAELFRWSESKGGEVTKRFLPPFSTPATFFDTSGMRQIGVPH
jgi:hypothetical protein